MLASSERIKEVLDEKPVQKKAENPQKPEIKGEIKFNDVSFAYAGASRNALSHISFTANPGETIGIIGPTGSGKTSLVNLIPRFYDTTEGAITVDGVNVNEIDEEYLRSKVALVAQKALLFTGTIMENLSWGLSNSHDNLSKEDESRIHKAVQIACADEFIGKTKDGYNTLLGQGGVNLSGGQKQRLSLARALIKEPNILILDDCTSALDATTESSVLKGLSEMETKATVLLISQRISTVMRANKILVLNNGEVQGFGTHTELLNNCSTYREIYESQIGGLDDGR